MIDGAYALAAPTKLGQSMTVIDNKEPGIRWIAKDVTETFGLKTIFMSMIFGQLYRRTKHFKLQQIFLVARELNPDFGKTYWVCG